VGLAETADLAIRISLSGNARAGIRGLKGDLKGLSGSIGRVGKGFGQIGAGFARAGLLVGGAAVTGLTAAAKAGASFEAELNTINTIARATPERLTAIGDGLRTLAREGRGELSDLSQGFYDILSAGITDAADAQKVLTSATTLAIGGLSTNAQAVDLLTTAINAYGQEASEAQRDADLFAKAIELGKVTADEIAASFANVAPIAAQQKIEIEEVAAAYAALTAQGVPAAEVTTQMQRAIVELLDPGKELLALQNKLGVSFLEMAQDKGLVVALQAMRDAVGDDDTAFKALFGRIEGYKFALQTTGPQQQIYNDALAAMGVAAGTASAQMGERTKGLAFQVGRLKANLIDAALTLSSGFLPALGRTADKLTEFLGNEGNRGALKALGEDIGKAIDDIDWNAVMRGATAFAGAMKSALDFVLLLVRAVDKLPAELKAAGLGFLALNKLSGGLVGAGVGNVVGGLAGAAATGLASRAPGVGRLFAQPVFVTNWPMGGLGGAAGAGGVAAAGGGKLSGAIGLISKVFIVGAAAEFASMLAGPIQDLGAEIGQQIPFMLKERQELGAAIFGVEKGVGSLRQQSVGAIHSSRNAMVAAERAAAARTASSTNAMKAGLSQKLTNLAATENRSRSAIIGAGHNDKNSIVGAIRANRPIINVRVSMPTIRVSSGGTTAQRWFNGKQVPI
jgi:TP901 family phage tail tape measure protein